MSNQITANRERAYALAPDIDEGLIDVGLELAAYFAENGRNALRHHYGPDRIVRKRVKNYSPKDATLYDVESGLYLKSYSTESHARLQYAAMNAMHKKLASEQVGVTAVRHLALFTEGLSPVALVEPANGNHLLESGGSAIEQVLRSREVIKRLRIGLGKSAANVLANDIMRPRNIGANVFVDDDDNYQIIDQPHYSRVMSLDVAKGAIKDLGWTDSLEGIEREANYRAYDAFIPRPI